MKEHVFEILKKIKDDKIQAGKTPAHVVKKELFDAINQALEELKAEGKINTGETINSTWIDPLE